MRLVGRARGGDALIGGGCGRADWSGVGQRRDVHLVHTELRKEDGELSVQGARVGGGGSVVLAEDTGEGDCGGGYW